MQARQAVNKIYTYASIFVAIRVHDSPYVFFLNFINICTMPLLYQRTSLRFFCLKKHEFQLVRSQKRTTNTNERRISFWRRRTAVFSKQICFLVMNKKMQLTLMPAGVICVYPHFYSALELLSVYQRCHFHYQSHLCHCL